MDLQKIKSLIRLFESSSLGSLDVSEGDFSLSLKRACDAPVQASAPSATPTAVPAAVPAPPETGHAVKSPLAVVFYASPTPDSAPFVKTGDRVKKGDTLCIIEAMKVMNELTADADGEVEAVLAENGQLVEYGQPLFRLKN